MVGSNHVPSIFKAVPGKGEGMEPAKSANDGRVQTLIFR